MKKVLKPYAVVLSIGLVVGWWVNGYRWESKHSALEQRLSDAATQAERRARDVETRWQIIIEEVEQDAQKQIAALRDSLFSIAFERDGMRDEIAEHTRRAAENSAAAGNCQAVLRAADLYAELLGELQDLAGTYAAAADCSRIKGQACESSYQSLR